MSASSDDRGGERPSGGGGEEEEGESGGGWLTTYADMVTLMLTFFVLLVAMASFDTENAELFMLAISQRGITAEQFWEIKDKYNFEDMDLDSWDDSFPGGPMDEVDSAGQQALQALYDSMTEYIEDEDLGEVIQMTFNGDFLQMVLASDILFDSGMASITPEMLEMAKVIGGLIARTVDPSDPYEIVVAGHTDNVPINTATYPSNWHLSRDRAVNFLWELINDTDIDPSLFYARACGEYRPIASNSTPEGRRLNRRVEVMISLARDNPLWDSGVDSQPATPPPAPPADDAQSATQTDDNSVG